MSKFMKKIRGGNGFTLVEMLIVVAIIAILIAISIPLVNSALDKAKHATDAANERAAKAEILIQYLADGGVAIAENREYWYDAAKGSLIDSTPTSPAPTAPSNYGKHKNHTYITVKVSGGEVTVAWKDGNALCSAVASH